MTECLDVAPILVTTDIARSLAHYRVLGFKTQAYADMYGYLEWDAVHLHIARVDGNDPATSNVACYLYVEDADEFHRRWSSSGAEGVFHAPADTDYGLREGAHVDPDGNLIRYGSFI